ncbi:MAG: hypothetical protein Q8936_06250 [Bacillota bacterium]|nr:hypothetical protein [Bacillota bacterium]
MEFKVRRVIFAVLLILLIGLTVNWLDISAANPKDAILKYASRHWLKYDKEKVEIVEGDFTDANYGKQFTAKGIKDEFGQELIFFYLKNDSGKWKVTSAGTGP